MKTLPNGMQAHLDSGATTLCWCWRVTRRDGLVLGFTDHDHDLLFDGTIFTAATGFETTDIEESVGLSVDNVDVVGALSSESLSESDLAAGRYDNATVEIFRVNWQDVSQRVLMRKGSIGEVRRTQGSFTAEIRGLAHLLQQPKGRIYQYACDADVGDARCQVDLDTAEFKGSGTILTVLSNRLFEVIGIETYADDWFSRGLLSWTSGPNQGLGVEVRLHRNTGDRVTIEIWHAPSETHAPGHSFSVTAGCDKQFSTCQAKFDNVLNFRGFPHMPGNDFVLSYPNRDDVENDGSSLVE